MDISFWLRAVDKSNQRMIYCSITLNGDRKGGAFSTRIKVTEDKWDSSRQRIKGKHIDNLTLDQHYEAIKNLYFQLTALNKPLTAQKIKETYLQGFVHQEISLLVYSREFVAKKQGLVGKSITIAVLKRWNLWIGKLETYLQKRKITNLLLSEVSQKHFVDFSNYLISEAHFKAYKIEKVGYSPEIVRKDCNFLKTVLASAYVDELIDRNRIAHCQYSVPKREKELVFLEVSEIDKIATYQFATDRLQKIADLFVFACYTSLAYSDLETFKADDIIIHEGKQWISKQRAKTGKKSLLPFFKPAKAIWYKYGESLPTLSNGKYNEYLKEIALVCGIEKHITTHTARRTAAMLFFENECELETVATMVGHSTAKTTRVYYTRMRMNHIASQLKKEGSQLEW